MSSAEQMEQTARQLIGERKYHEAAELCDQLNQAFPDYSSGWYTSSHLAMLINEPRVAVGAIDRALQLSPGKPEWLFKRVEYLAALGEKAAAIATAEQLSEHQFGSAELSIAFARTLAHLGQFELARRHFKRATELDPNNGLSFFGLAAVERSLGNAEAAHDAASRCIELRPDDAEAHLMRSGLLPHKPDVNNTDDLRAAIERAGSDAQRCVKLNFALAKELEDIGEYEQSFAALNVGASIRRNAMKYDSETDLASIRGIKSTYGAEMFDRDIEGFINAEPIFVIGLPRTGNVLVDCILGNHSVVHSAGELQTFAAELVNHCRKEHESRQYSEADFIAASVNIDFEKLGEDYIAATRPATGATAHFVDRNPQNFLYIGLIKLALPKAKIVLLERDPMDTCYAIYRNLFDNAYPFSYNLEELGTCFRAYQELMEHWKAVTPGTIHTVNYEALVTNPRPVVEDLLDFCGLSWEEACLDFEGRSTANTDAPLPDLEFFRASIGQSKHYKEQLKLLADILGDSIEGQT